MNKVETETYLIEKLDRYKAMFDHKTLATYAPFEIAHVGMLRPKSSLDTIEEFDEIPTRTQSLRGHRYDGGFARVIHYDKDGFRKW